MRQLVDVLNLECVEQRVAACLERPAKGRESRKNGVTGLASQSRLPRIARNSVSRLGNCQREQRECQNSCTKCKSTRPMVTHTGPPTCSTTKRRQSPLNQAFFTQNRHHPAGSIGPATSLHAEGG